jgi:hypothetical protein
MAWCGLLENQTSVQKYQRENMKNTIKATLVALAVVGVTSGARAAYSGDLLVGFTTTTGNDLVYDLGLFTSLTDGETWNMTAPIASTSNSGLLSSSVQWGVIGTKNTGGVRSSWATKVGSAPPAIPNTTTFNNIDLDTTSMAGSLGVTTTSSPGTFASEDSSSATPNSWNQQTISSPSAGSYHKVNVNPNTTGSSTVSFYQTISGGTASSLVGTFNFDTSSGILTFDAVSVPEPSTYGMFAAAGVLLVGLRNQFRRKQA